MLIVTEEESTLFDYGNHELLATEYWPEAQTYEGEAEVIQITMTGPPSSSKPIPQAAEIINWVKDNVPGYGGRPLAMMVWADRSLFNASGYYVELYDAQWAPWDTVLKALQKAIVWPTNNLIPFKIIRKYWHAIPDLPKAIQTGINAAAQTVAETVSGIAGTLIKSLAGGFVGALGPLAFAPLAIGGVLIVLALKNPERTERIVSSGVRIAKVAAL